MKHLDFSRVYCSKMLFKAFLVLLTYLAYTLNPSKFKPDMIHQTKTDTGKCLELDPGVQSIIAMRK